MNKTHELKRMTNGYIGDDNVVREQFPVDANAYAIRRNMFGGESINYE